MYNLMTFIMSKKFLPILFLLIGAGVFFTVKTMGRGDGTNDNPRTKNEKINPCTANREGCTVWK